jgi:hypothetical protein
LGVLLQSGPRRLDVRTKTGIDMDTPEESRVSRSAKEGRIGPGGKPSSQKRCYSGQVVFSFITRNHTNLFKMRIYKDIFTGDEMFSDTYKMKLVDEVLYEVYGKLIQRKEGDIQLDGANPSADDADEGTDENVQSGVDIVMNHRLCETFAFGDKKSYTAYLKDYMKKLVAKLEEKSPDQVDVFKTNMNKVMKDILGRFKELQFFTGESMEIEGMVGLMEYREINGDSVPVMMFFKHGLDEEKF